MFQGSFRSVSRKFQERFREVSGKYQGCFKKVLWVFQVRLKGVSSSFKGFSRVFERTGISVSVSKVFQGSFKGVPRKF